MKKLILYLLLIAVGFTANAQTAPTRIKYPIGDQSAMDALYYPINATKVKKEDNSKPIIKILYSRPGKKGREIFGVLELFDKVWRLGANENTEIYFAKRATIGGKKIKPGTYSLFAILNKDKWTIIVNKQTDRWGAFSYDETKDIVRVDVPVTTLVDQVVEKFSMTFVDSAEGADLYMAWDTTQVMLPIQFKK